MDITIEGVVDALVDPSFQAVEIWDCEKEETVFSGMAEDIPEQYLECNCTIDNITNNIICFNV